MSRSVVAATGAGLLAAAGALLALTSCELPKPSSDDVQRRQQEVILQEGTAAVGMPAIKNFRERRLMKDLYELRDQASLPTFTYVQSMNGRLVFLCDSIGYGIPYATQMTNPQKVEYSSLHGTYNLSVLPQADPNGLFSPASADGTWVMCKDSAGTDVKPVFIEPKVVVSPFRFPHAEDKAPVAPAAVEAPAAASARPSKKLTY